MTETGLSEGEATTMELSEYAFETLRRDEDFIVYRSHHRRQADASPPSIAAMTPVLERPALANLLHGGERDRY